MNVISIFNYEPFYGFYVSTEQYQLQHGFGLPAHSTDIEPPILICAEGFIPIFKNGHWLIVEDNFWRPKEGPEFNYDAKRDSITYTPINLSLQAFPKYPSLPMICNSHLIALEITQKVRVVQRKFKELSKLHAEMDNNFQKVNEYPTDGPYLCLKGFEEHEANLYKYHFLCDEMVSHMKTTIDRIIQLSFVLTKFDDYISERYVRVSQIGNLGNNNNPKDDFERVVVGDDCKFKKDQTNFLKCINDLSNSFKHSMMHAEIYSIRGRDVATVCSYQAKDNKHRKEIIYHNHNACHLVMGFQDTVLRVLENHRRYVDLNT